MTPETPAGYEAHTLSSGRVVHLRPLPYAEFVKHEDRKLALLDKVAELARDGSLAAQTQADALLSRNRVEEAREVAEACVEKWKTVQKDMARYEVEEIHVRLVEMSMPKWREKNSDPSGGGTATARG